MYFKNGLELIIKYFPLSPSDSKASYLKFIYNSVNNWDNSLVSESVSN